MRTTITFLTIIFFFINSTAQSIVEWSPDEVIDIRSFKAACPEMADDGIQRYSLVATFDFNYQMANIQFIMTKNFNKYVTSYYIPNNSWIEKGELTDQIFKMANLDFDILELFARKFRKQMFENKRAGSNTNFYQQLFNEVNKEYTAFTASLNSEIVSSENVDELLSKYSSQVNLEIESLSDYCKACKPKKKKKKRKNK